MRNVSAFRYDHPLGMGNILGSCVGKRHEVTEPGDFGRLGGIASGTT